MQNSFHIKIFFIFSYFLFLQPGFAQEKEKIWFSKYYYVDLFNQPKEKDSIRFVRKRVKQLIYILMSEQENQFVLYKFFSKLPKAKYELLHDDIYIDRENKDTLILHQKLFKSYLKSPVFDSMQYTVVLKKHPHVTTKKLKDEYLTKGIWKIKNVQLILTYETKFDLEHHRVYRKQAEAAYVKFNPDHTAVMYAVNKKDSMKVRWELIYFWDINFLIFKNDFGETFWFYDTDNRFPLIVKRFTDKKIKFLNWNKGKVNNMKLIKVTD